MSLASGTRLGSYEVLAPLGAGGMGEVYRAHDSRLGRDVAIRLLPEALASSPEPMRIMAGPLRRGRYADENMTTSTEGAAS